MIYCPFFSAIHFSHFTFTTFFLLTISLLVFLFLLVIGEKLLIYYYAGREFYIGMKAKQWKGESALFKNDHGYNDYSDDDNYFVWTRTKEIINKKFLEDNLKLNKKHLGDADLCGIIAYKSEATLELKDCNSELFAFCEMETC